MECTNFHTGRSNAAVCPYSGLQKCPLLTGSYRLMYIIVFLYGARDRGRIFQ